MAVWRAKNNEVLLSSETFKSKASAWKNIKSALLLHPPIADFEVQDDTLKLPLIFTVRIADGALFKIKSLPAKPGNRYSTKK